MEIIDEDDEEVKRLMLRISRKEITLCDSCDTFFDYIPKVKTCDECKEKKYREVKAKKREYNQRPEVKERRREYEQRPEVKERKREYEQRPEIKKRRNLLSRERNLRKKKLREEEWFLLDAQICKTTNRQNRGLLPYRKGVYE